MSDDTPRAIRPADIIELIRTTKEQGFVQRNFKDAPDDGVFAPTSAKDTAVILEPDESPETAQPVPPPAPPGIPEAEVEVRVEAARKAAKAEGIAEEQARSKEEIDKLKAELEEAKITLLSMVHRLSEVHPEDSATLSTALEEAVLRLASERAGLAIDEMPSGMMSRIETLADRVSQGIRTVRIRLNPADHEAVAPLLESSETLDATMLKSDPALGRGDVVIRSEAIRLEDVIAPTAGCAKPKDTDQ